MIDTIVIKNEQHSLLKEQVVLLENKFSSYRFLNIPKNGLDINKQLECIKMLSKLKCNVVFLSPIPVMLGKLSKEKENKVFVFTNDRRSKVEIDGQISFKLQDSGWQLCEI